MAAWDLPTSVTVGGREYEIRTDYRVILDVMQAMAAPELDEQERTIVCLSCFYPDFSWPDSIPFHTREEQEEAIERMCWFVDGGVDRRPDGRRRPRLMDWEQDFHLIVGPVNKVAGCEVRALPYLHWWTFLSYYTEIDGECTFATVVGIRRKLAEGKRLDKADAKFRREHRDLVELKNRMTDEEAALLAEWTS